MQEEQARLLQRPEVQLLVKQAEQDRQQLVNNASTVALDPGTARSLQFYLQPQPSGSDHILVGVHDGAMQLSIHLPNGRIVDANTAGAAGIKWERSVGLWVLGLCEPVVDWVVVDLPPGSMPGQYSIEGRLPKGASKTTLCATFSTLGVGGTTDESFGVGGAWVKTDHEIYQLGDSVIVSVPVMGSGRPVKDARVEAVISYMDDTGQIKGEAGRIRLSEANDGDYSGIFQPSIAGRYAVLVSISGRNAKQSGKFSVTPAAGRLTSAILTRVNGEMRAVMKFHIVLAGHYVITPTLHSADGKTDNTSLDADWTPGDHEVIWHITREELEVLQTAPPYELAEIHVRRDNPTALHRADVVGWWFYKAGHWQPK